MKRYQDFINLFVFIIIVALTFNVDTNPFTTNNIETVSVTDMSTSDALYEEIQEKSTNLNQKAQDAYIDKVWKKTPGRNGLKVNIHRSYEQMKKEGSFNESLLIYDQVPPDITLEDLPAAPIYRGHPEKHMVSLLINVSWGGEYIPDMLNILKEHDVKATFFIEGKWAKENIEYVKMIDEQGHTIGNHAYNHPDMARLSNNAIVEQVRKTNEVLKAITGDEPKWFAPPSGSYSDLVVEKVDQLGMETILWTVDTIDWKNPSVSVMMNRVMGKVHPGATVLMHPTSSVVNALPNMISGFKEKGFKIGTIDQLLDEAR
ncbi:probable sporulation protein, polysaccharide deacetylase family [Oceanobacillus limi]|uniref:Probable sporulation protein, polysaccharide deacetylase family n=1 Tax=Oceanobacillus limi TaxID=930131 RepID=A0A1H9Z6J2_9BACI|nr:polysaccharide deacetylase family protein [Oceanobacillus limi]SES76481.1 probable sporulation protein, polysaccharide deacetylase family [Oceanobacillus limi]